MCTSMFAATIIHSGQDMETTKVSFASLLDKDVIHNTMEYSLAIRRDEILPFVTTCMELENIMLSEISKK